MSQKSCFFIGHRETPEEIYPVLCAAVEEHIVRYGVTEFIVGRYGCFDGLAAKAVKTAKQTHPEVELTLLLPYHPAERPIPVPDGFDSTYYPPGMEMSLVRLLLSGQIGIWSIILISSLPMRGTLPAMQETFSNNAKKRGQRVNPGDSLAAYRFIRKSHYFYIVFILRKVMTL